MDAQTASIEVRVDAISQLFDSLDPFPFRDRDLDSRAEEYIVGWARELASNQALRIVVHLPPREIESESAGQVGVSLKRYFAYRAGIIARELSDLFRVGRISALIGASVLALCVLMAHGVTAVLGEGNIARIVEESLIIVGWVANWKPLEIFLYDWWPLARHRDLYRRLAEASVELTAD